MMFKWWEEQIVHLLASDTVTRNVRDSQNLLAVNKCSSHGNLMIFFDLTNSSQSEGRGFKPDML